MRKRLEEKRILLAPGVYDAFTALIAEQAGFEALYLTGAGLAYTRLGRSDIGLVTASEVADTLANICDRVRIPVIVDADTGFGNALNTARTVREFEARGVAAIHIEDQASPKRCGHLDGKEIIPAPQFIAKIRAAVAARRDPDFLIIARTDSRAVAGFDEAITRANAAIEAGADMTFVEAVQTPEELAAVPKRVRGPCLLNIVPGGKTPRVSLAEAQALGYRLAILPGLLLSAVMVAADQALRAVKESGALPETPRSANVVETFRRFGADEWNALRQRFAAEG